MYRTGAEHACQLVTEKGDAGTPFLLSSKTGEVVTGGVVCFGDTDGP